MGSTTRRRIIGFHREHPQGRSAPLWGTAEGRAYALFVESDDSVPGCGSHAGSCVFWVRWGKSYGLFDKFLMWIPYSDLLTIALRQVNFVAECRQVSV